MKGLHSLGVQCSQIDAKPTPDPNKGLAPFAVADGPGSNATHVQAGKPMTSAALPPRSIQKVALTDPNPVDI